MDELSRSAEAPVDKNLELSVPQKSMDPAHNLQWTSAVYQGQEQIFLPHAVGRSRQVEERHDRPLRLVVLKAVTNVLSHSEKLVFTASVHPKACFSEVVESMHYHTFQGLDRARGQTDRAERLDVAGRFPHIEQRDDGGVPLGLWHFSLVKALVQYGQQFLFRGQPEGLEERRRDIIRPAAPLLLIFLMARFRSSRLKSAAAQSPALGACIHLFASLMRSRLGLVNFSLLIFA